MIETRVNISIEAGANHNPCRSCQRWKSYPTPLLFRTPTSKACLARSFALYLHFRRLEFRVDQLSLSSTSTKNHFPLYFPTDTRSLCPSASHYQAFGELLRLPTFNLTRRREPQSRITHNTTRDPNLPLLLHLSSKVSTVNCQWPWTIVSCVTGVLRGIFPRTPGHEIANPGPRRNEQRATRRA